MPSAAQGMERSWINRRAGNGAWVEAQDGGQVAHPQTVPGKRTWGEVQGAAQSGERVREVATEQKADPQLGRDGALQPFGEAVRRGAGGASQCVDSIGG